MTAYNFKARFADRIIAKTKTQTCRATRKDGWVPPEAGALQLYTGLRTRNTRLLGTAKIISVAGLVIDWAHSWVDITRNHVTKRVDCWVMAPLDEFARADGFDSWEEYWKFFHAVHPEPVFTGYIVTWGDTFVPADKTLREPKP